MNWLQRLIKGLGRRGSNAPLAFDEWLATPPPKIAAAINRHLDREIDREIARRQRASFPTLDQAIASDTLRRRGSNPPAPGNKPPAPSGPPTKPQPTGGRLIYTDRELSFWRTIAWLAFAEGRRQAQSPQLPTPGADPVATDEELVEELADLWPGCMPSTVRRTIYQKGRADERTAILRALGVDP